LSPYRTREVRAALASSPDGDECARYAKPGEHQQLCRSRCQHSSGVGKYAYGKPHGGTKQDAAADIKCG
jgi:hypothetical protein